MAMLSTQTPSPVLQLGTVPVETCSSPQFSHSLDSVPFSLHLLEYRNATEAQGAVADLFCSFLWGAGLHPLLSHLGSCPGLGLTS